jgi:hypothetical protein
MSTAMFSTGLDVHKDSVTITVFRNRAPEPMRVDRLHYDHGRICRHFEPLSAEGERPRLQIESPNPRMSRAA